MARRTAKWEEENDPDVIPPMTDGRLLMMVLGNLLKLPLVAVWLVKATQLG